MNEVAVGLVPTTCVCGETSATILGEKSERFVGTCDTCGVTRTLQRAEDYEQLYTDGDKYHVEREGHTPYRDRFNHDYGISAVRWPKLVGNLRLLDVGCANGAFVKYASQMGFDAYGLELNPNMARWASEQTKCRIYTRWEDLPTAFDIVTLHDVFEHVVDPHAYIDQINEYLMKTGVLCLDVPDIHDTSVLKHGMESHHMKPLEHLWFWNEDSLIKLLQDHGYEDFTVDRPIPGKLVVYAR